jgi:hypothetical protein
MYHSNRILSTKKEISEFAEEKGYSTIVAVSNTEPDE